MCFVVVLILFIILVYKIYEYGIACTSFCEQYMQDVETLFGTDFVKCNQDKIQNIAEEEYIGQVRKHQSSSSRDVMSVFYINRKGFYREVKKLFGEKFVKEHFDFLNRYYTMKVLFIE